jgi:hypothetical protein
MTHRPLYPGTKNPLICSIGGTGEGPQSRSVDFGKGKSFYLLPRFIAPLLGYPAITLVTVPTELSAVTHISLFLGCHECL